MLSEVIDVAGPIMLWGVFFAPLAVFGVMAIIDRLHGASLSRASSHLVPRSLSELTDVPLQLLSLRMLRLDYELLDKGMVRATFRSTPFRYGRVAEGVCAAGDWVLEQRGWCTKTFTFRVGMGNLPREVYQYVGDGFRYAATTDNALPFSFVYGIPESTVFSGSAPLATIHNVSLWPTGMTQNLALHPPSAIRRDLIPVLMIFLYLKKSRDFAFTSGGGST